MAGTGKFEDLHLGDLSLEPMPDPNLLNYQPTKSVAEKLSADPHLRNTRVTDRRVQLDRRKTPRFEANRRTGKERRPSKSWREDGNNI